MKLKKFFLTSLFFIIFVTSNTVLASEINNKVNYVYPKINYSSGVENDNGMTTYEVLNPEEIAYYYGINDPKKVTITIFDNKSQDLNISTPTPKAVYIDNIIGPLQSCGADEIAKDSAINMSDKTVTKSINLSGSASNKYSTNVSGGINVDVASISAGVGFDVTKTITVSDTTNVELKPGESVHVYGYPYYDVYNFDIIYDPFIGSSSKIGFGNAMKVVGLCTIVK